MKRLFAVLLCLGVAACNRTPPSAEFPPPGSLPSVQAELSNPRPRLGENMRLRVRVSAESPLKLPAIEDWLHPALRVLEESQEETTSADGWSRDHELRLALFSVTNLSLFAEGRLRSLDEPAVELGLPFIGIEAQGVLTADAEALPNFGNDELPDFRGSEMLRRRQRNLLLGLLTALILLGLGIWAARLAARRPKPVPPPTPPHRVALREMEALRADAIWLRPDVDACAVRLSQILRQYIEARFDIQAPDLTTEEFLLAAEARAPWPESEQAGLRKFFEATDRIKYAADRPGRERLTSLWEAARAFVEHTKQELLA